jgi:glycerol-3-phosphate dehydrogenase
MQRIDVLIFGGGVAGMWLLDTLHRAGRRTLLAERYQLGRGQTVSAQGIIHGGLKYTLKGRLTGSAEAIRDAPGRWRRSLEGDEAPDLTHTPVRADFCYLWRTRQLSSVFGAIGAKQGLRVTPKSIPREDRPAVLRDCPGEVMRLDEQVIDPVALLDDLLGQHRDRTGKYEQVHIEPDTGEVTFDDRWTVRADQIVFAAGKGNAELRGACGLPTETMQLRPLHMAMVRGPKLPWLNGHCVDGKATRVTITSAKSEGDTVWQLGGRISELGVDQDAETLVEVGQQELREVLPNFDPGGLRWAAYRVDRAEAKTPGLFRPEGPSVQRDGRLITAWPTKLAMAPHLAERIIDELAQATATPPDEGGEAGGGVAWPEDWPRPAVAPAPWETASTWTSAP